ncbi:MAG TPA: sigma factor [Luteolibacter sp.]|nr:sigma factor [Luteolibacter sp.]
MMDAAPSPFHDLPSGLCEDGSGRAAALIRRIGRGDGAALVELHELWAPVLLGIACRMLGDRRAADDLLRKIFAKIRKSADSYNPHQSPPFVWAFAMLRDAAARQIRHSNSTRRNPPPPEHNDAPAVLGAEDCRRLRTALERLDPEARMCLEQAVFLDFAHSASAPPAGPLKTRLRLALETVRTQLSCHEL